MRMKLLIAALAATTLSVAHAASSKYELITVERTSAQMTIAVAGTVTAAKNVQLTAQHPGRVIEITGREGDGFQQGAMLLRLDESAMMARRDAAYASRESARASIYNAYANLQREYIAPRSNSAGSAPGGMGMPAMMDQVFTSPMQGFMGMPDNNVQRHSDLVGAQTGLMQAQNALRQADASIQEVEAALRDMRSIAPFSGVVDRVYVEVGDTVQPGQPLVDFSQAGQYKIDADLPVNLARGLQPGQKLTAILDNAGHSTYAEVFRIHPSADRQRHTMRVELALPVNTAVTNGQYVRVNVPAGNSNSPAQLSIPNSAVVQRGSMQLVYAVNDKGLARLRVVRLGDQLGDERRTVLSGVQEGDTLVNNPPPGLSAGTQVRPVTLTTTSDTATDAAN